jgi:hypothetical protein
MMISDLTVPAPQTDSRIDGLAFSRVSGGRPFFAINLRRNSARGLASCLSVESVSWADTLVGRPRAFCGILKVRRCREGFR